MEHNTVGCQVCLTRFSRMFDLKKHMRSRAHQEKMKEVFQKDMFKGPGFFPFIVLMDPQAKHEMKLPIIGLSLLTLCFSPETKTFFYLCHVCEEKRPPGNILHHLSSGDHCSNYFNYTDPNVLTFSWVPSMDMRVILKPAVTKEVNDRGSGQLQMLDLPGNLLKKLDTSTYSEVMCTLRENDKLLKLLEAVKPKRTMIQTYQRDGNRKHPLLGMQHLVECICVGATDERYYLCTLCNLTLATRMVIKHVLSFDHIFCYFKAWHPSTLLSKGCYKDYTKQSASKILDFAKQTQEIHGTANTDMKQVSLEPGEFTSVNFACYAEALKQLESITKENKEISLITIVKPGNKLEFRNVSEEPVALSYKLGCQNCSETFETVSQYNNHLPQWKHKQMLKRFHADDDGVEKGWKRSLGLCRYLTEISKQNQPAIGLSLVVMCVSTQVQEEPIYVCFACKKCFPESSLRQHFNSRKHLIRTMLHQNPWQLPFAWESPLDVKLLRSMAWEEEKGKGPNQRVLKVLDIPHWMFQRLTPPSYPKVIEKLQLHISVLKRGVPRCETYTKLKQNERFPLLGIQFMVMHVVYVRLHQSTAVGFLCLLCERRLSDDECDAHVFSREHVGKFLDCFYPGSLNSSTDAETVLDLAQQAGRNHPISHIQVINLDKPIWEPCSYHRAKSILASTKRRKGKGKLEPPIMPQTKLFPRETFKEVDKDDVRDSQENSRLMEESEKKLGEKSTDNTETPLTRISVVGAEITNTHCVESGADRETPTPGEEESEKRREVSSEAGSEETKHAGRDTCQAIKEEKMEEPTMREPHGETLDSCQNTGTNDGTEIGEEERSKSSKDVPTQLKNNIYRANEGKRPSSMFEKSQGDMCPDGVEKDMGHKRQRLTSKEDSSSEEPQNPPSSGRKEATTADKGESCKPSHETAEDKASSDVNHQQAAHLWQYVKRKNREPVIGLSALLECHCDQRDPIYLCECCSLKIPEKDIISHVTGFDHQKMYLGVQTLPRNRRRKKIRLRAALFEKDKGSGDAQVVELDEEIFNNISKQSFKSAIQTVKALQGQQDSRSELPSTSALSAAQLVITSVAPHAQHSVTEDCKASQTGVILVVKMEIDDDSEGSVVQPSSVTAAVSGKTETTSKTTKVPPESNEDVRMTHITVSESADNGNTFQTVSRSSEVGSNADVAPNIPNSNAPAAPQLTTLTSVRAENKSPPSKPSHASACKKKPSQGPKVGLNQLIAVSCEGRQQVYCQMCSVRLKKSSHLFAFSHRYNYVKMMFPEWNAKPSELDAKLAEVEKDVGSQSCQMIPVKIDLYRELAALPEYKAVERLKAMLRQRDLGVSSSSSTDAAEVLRHQVASTSPCEVSSPDDGMNMQQNEMAGLSTDNQSEQENKHVLQRLLVQMPGEDGNLAPGQSGRAQSLNGRSPEANDLISDQLHLCPTLTNEPKPISTPSTHDADIAVKMEKPQGCADPLATDSESAGRFPQTPDTCPETPEKGQQQERSDAELQDTQKVLEGTQKTSPVKCFNADPRSAAALVNTEQQNQSKPSQNAEHVLNRSGCSAGPWHHSASPALPRISVGERTQSRSHLSSYLKVKGMETERIIGLGSVWECRGITLKPFFLCESCRETLSSNEICQHMVSDKHQFEYIMRQYPQFLQFWPEKDLLPCMKLDLFYDIAELLAKREQKTEAQCVLLGKELYDCVRTAPFSEALKMVQNITKEEKLSVVCLPISTPQQKDQQPEDGQSREESLPTEMQSAQALETEQRSDNDARQKTEERHLERTVMVGDLGGVEQRRVSSPLDVTSVSSKADSAVSPFPGAGTCLSQTCKSLSMQPELKPPVSQQQRPIPKLHVKQPEMHSESPSSSIVSPTQTLSVTPSDNCLPTRKRPAVTPVQTLVRPCTNNPQREDPLPAKCPRTCSSLQPISQPSPESASESTPVNPAATSTLLSPKDEDAGPGFDEQDAAIVDWTQFAHLIALVRERRSETNVFSCMSAPDNAATTPSCANTSPECDVERRSIMARRRGRCNSRCQLIKATVKRSPPSTHSLGMFSAAAPAVSGYDNQLATRNADSAFSASNSSLDLVFRAPEAEAVGTALRSASTADPSEPQHQRGVNAQSVFGNVSQFKPSPYYCVARSHNPGQIPQPRGNPETGCTGVCQLPINAVITDRPDPTNWLFMDGYNGQNHTEVSRGNQVSHSFSTIATARPSDTLAASGGYAQYSPVVYVARGYSGCLYSETVAGCVTPDNPPVHTGSSYQHEEYTMRGLYPSQIHPEQEANGVRHRVQAQQQQLAQQQQQLVQRQQLAQQQQLVQQQQLAQQQQQQQLVQRQQLAQQQQLAQRQQQLAQRQQQLAQQLAQQQLTQQQYSSWTSAALAARNGGVTSEGAYSRAVQFPAPANNSQRFIDLNDYRTSSIVPTQSTAQVYLNPPVFHSSPTANTEIISQASANSFFASGGGVLTVAPSMVNATPLVSPETTHYTM